MAGSFWQGRRVLVTGHTGFKGGWLAVWLKMLGAEVAGYALAPSTDPSLFAAADISDETRSTLGDIRDLAGLKAVFEAFRPQIVFHLAAQALVRLSYAQPVQTYSTNVMGTVHVLEAVRLVGGVQAIVNITSDKCYDNREWCWGYRETEPMGGYDAYASSKACAELVAGAYRSSFFNPEDYSRHGVALASARAGNVVGGGDWSPDRLVADVIRSLDEGGAPVIRNPDAVRPWQHVLEPLSGYLLLAQRLCEDGPRFAEAWNFGPEDADAQPVHAVVRKLSLALGHSGEWKPDPGHHPHEAGFLKLDCAKAKARLGWRPRWDLDRALLAVAEWHGAFRGGQDLKRLMRRQIESYQSTPVCG